MLKEKIDTLKEEIIHSTCELIQIPSVNSDTNNPSMPFGKNCAHALDYILNLGKKLGFRTKNIDGYCGYIEFGEGKELLGIIGHLDVVPAESENWTYPPFSATIIDNKIFGRGAIDDKGPVIASLYAMKAVMDTCQINKRVRLILGLNEEKDWKCIEYYKTHDEIPTLGFSPDADFPCIYAEKALLNVYLTSPYTNNSSIQILDVDCANNAINVVPKFCQVRLKIDESISETTCIHNLETIVQKYKFKVESTISNHILTITSYGIAAHAAHPDLGKNAISQILVVLYEFLKIYSIDVELFTKFNEYFHLDYFGEKLGIATTDESGLLTLNVAQFSFQNNRLTLGMNLRIPIHTPILKIKDKINHVFCHTSMNVTYPYEKESLYLAKNIPLIQTLCSIFHQNTGLDSTPIAIGGATYARAFPNCVSFGANMPGQKDMCHQVDEFIAIDNLITCSKIYAEAIYELTK